MSLGIPWSDLLGRYRIPTLMAVPGVVILLALGTWQVTRHFERTAENAVRAERLAAAPIPLDQAGADPEANRFRRVRVEGRFDHAHEIRVYARSLNGNEGLFIVTPLLRDGALPVLVNRGWVPTRLGDPARRPQGQVEGPVAIDGVLRTEARRPPLAPDNEVAGNHWFWFDLPAMARAAGLARVWPGYVEAGPAPNPGGYPVGGQTQEQLPRPHLQYAFTWYALAVAFAVIYVMFVRGRRN